MTNTKARRWLASYVGSKDGKSRSRIADLLGISQPAVSGWVDGITRPNDVHRKALERLIGLPADDWMTRDEVRLVYGADTKTGTEG